MFPKLCVSEISDSELNTGLCEPELNVPELCIPGDLCFRGVCVCVCVRERACNDECVGITNSVDILTLGIA